MTADVCEISSWYCGAKCIEEYTTCRIAETLAEADRSASTRLEGTVADVNARLGDEIDDVNTRLGAVDAKITALDDRSAAMGASVGNMDTRLTTLRTAVDTRLASLEENAKCTTLLNGIRRCDAVPSGYATRLMDSLTSADISHNSSNFCVGINDDKVHDYLQRRLHPRSALSAPSTNVFNPDLPDNFLCFEGDKLHYYVDNVVPMAVLDHFAKNPRRLFGGPFREDTGCDSSECLGKECSDIPDAYSRCATCAPPHACNALKLDESYRTRGT